MSTPEHMHFAGYVIGRTPQLHMTYLMWKHGVGFRVGTSRTYTNGQAKAAFGPALRCNGEGGDAVWVIGTHESDAEARLHEACCPRVRTSDVAVQGAPSSVGSTAAWSAIRRSIDRLFATLDTEKAGYTLLADEDLSFDYPHHAAHGSHGRGVGHRPGGGSPWCSAATGAAAVRSTGSRCSATTTRAVAALERSD